MWFPILGVDQVISRSRWWFAVVQAIFLSVFLAFSPVAAQKKKPMTPMELQAIQSREFDVPKEAAFGAVMTVIQDLGYTVQSADVISGFITAASPNENKTNFLEALGGVASSGNTVMTVFILQMPSKFTRIRLNFVNSRSISTSYGQSSRQDKPILDAAVYNNAWERIDEALFVMGALADTSGSDQGRPSSNVDVESRSTDHNSTSDVKEGSPVSQSTPEPLSI
jgi:hypothetical protein